MLLFELARDVRSEQASALYRWFLPLLRLDTVPEFVQLIKLVQSKVGQGSENVRLPRLPVDGGMRRFRYRRFGCSGCSGLFFCAARQVDGGRNGQ